MDGSASDFPSSAGEYELVSQFNPVIGRTQWKPVRTDYDYAQEIALSGYGDMLHDTDRNRKYHEAIKVAIRVLRSSQPTRPIRVLDIGTGTGLLAMMAALQGADSVIACEAFRPMAECARVVLRDNQLDSRIQVVDKQSTKLSVPNHLPERANMLVAELLDTELIGEACLSTYKQAAESLLTDDATLVPYGADLYCQVVESPFLWSHHRLSRFEPNSENDLSLGRFESALLNDTISSCAGAPSVFDIQASELEAVSTDEPSVLGDRQLRCLLDRPVLIKHFNFAPPADRILLEDACRITHTENGTPLTASRSGIAHAFVVWWRLKMEPSHTVPDISTAPSWAGDSEYAWRDHWMQAVYFPRYPLQLFKGQPVHIDFRHDLLSLWFEFAKPGTDSVEQSVRPVCECGLHYSWPRTRIAHVNSEGYRTHTRNLVDRVRIQLNSICSSRSVHLVVISDCTLLPIFLSEALVTGASRRTVHIEHIETSACSARFLQTVYQQVRADGDASPSIQLFDSMSTWIQSFRDTFAQEQAAEPHVLVLGEPFAVAASLPWDALHFWYAYEELRAAFPRLDACLFGPSRMRIWAVLVEFDQLWKIRAPVGQRCEGFNLSAFDRLVQPAMQQVHAVVEPQPLWEYGAFARSQPCVVFELDLTQSQSDLASSYSGSPAPVTLSTPPTPPSSISSPQAVNGIAFWADWLMPYGSSETDSWYAPAGPSIPVRPGQRIRWNATGLQQGVTLLPSPLTLCAGPDGNKAREIHVPIHVSFHVDSGEIRFQINVPDLYRHCP